jgi:hypothetical protein
MSDRPRDLIYDYGFRREINALHQLGPRVTGELIAELVHRHGPEARSTMASFAALDHGTLAELDALLWPRLPLHVVPKEAA